MNNIHAAGHIMSEFGFDSDASKMRVVPEGVGNVFKSGELAPNSEVPKHIEQLSDGSDIAVIGDGEGFSGYLHQQGQNAQEFEGDCGLVSVEQIVRYTGEETDETTVVQRAIDNGLCAITDNPESSGGTTVQDQVRMLESFGIPAHADIDITLEGLAKKVEAGDGVIAEVNAGVLWNDPGSYEGGRANHAIVVTDVVKNPYDAKILGFHINDSGSGEAHRFVDAVTMKEAYLGGGWFKHLGCSVATDKPLTARIA